TAQKKNERLQGVPIPVAALSADDLVRDNKVRLEDYYTRVPGLSYTPSTFGASTPFGGGSIVPDIDPSDLQSVEVLRGPQGTLYGASSIGGLLKFVTR